MGVSDDLTAAAGHVAGLRRAVTALSKELGNTIDVQRLRDDVVRLADDVDLVARGSRSRLPGPRRWAGRDRLHHRRGVRPLAVVRRRGRGRRPLPGPLTCRTSPSAEASMHPAGPASPRARSARTAGGSSPSSRSSASSAWLLYGLVRASLQKDYFVADYGYLTPFDSPCLSTSCVPGSTHFGTPFGEWPALIPFAALTLPFLLLFRLTCYYYRKAYYRSFWNSPPACAVPEAHREYSGETRFPLIVQNLHRYFFYAAVVISPDQHLRRAARVPRQGRWLRARPRHADPAGQRRAALVLHARLPLLPQHRRRSAQPLQQAPAALQGLGPGGQAQRPPHDCSPG